MTGNGYTENVFTTTNTKLAAVVLTFGAKLQQHMPLEWVDVYASKADYLAHRRDPRRNTPKARVSFNFEPVGFDLRAFAAGYENTAADDEFSELTANLGLE